MPVDPAPLAAVAAVLEAAGALPVGLDAASQARVRATLQPLAGLLAGWSVAETEPVAATA